VRLPRIEKRRLLYKSKVPYADLAINHVLGCSHGCLYPCYARLMSRESYPEWRKPRIVGNALELLDKELRRLTKPHKVYLCFMTDPYMVGFPEIHDLTNEILRRLLEFKHSPVILTKGVITPSPDLLGRGVEWGITLCSLHPLFRLRYEPFSAPLGSRLSALRTLAERGEFTWVSMEPYPHPSVFKYQRLSELLKAVKWTRRIVFGRWNYAGVNDEVFYQGEGEKVKRFCERQGIDFILKEGKIK